MKISVRFGFRERKKNKTKAKIDLVLHTRANVAISGLQFLASATEIGLKLLTMIRCQTTSLVQNHDVTAQIS